MEIQKKLIFESILNGHNKGFDQRDDVTVLGIKLD